MIWTPVEAASEEQLEFQIEEQEPLETEQTVEQAEYHFPLDQLLRRTGPLPPYTALLGICADGRPYLFDLNNPKPGSILISGGSRCGKTSLLRALLASICRLNPPEKVKFGVLAKQEDEWCDFLDTSHCVGLLPAGDRSAIEIIEDFASIVVQRQELLARPDFDGRFQDEQDGPILLLAVDDLVALKRTLSENSFNLLCWLAYYGPQCGVWVLATLSAGQLRSEQPVFHSHFRTRMFGSTAGTESNPMGPEATPNLEPGQFALQTSRGWVRFWSPFVEPSSIL